MSDKVLFYEWDADLDKSNWREVYSAALGKAISNQLALKNYIRLGQKWELNLEAGVLTLEDAEYPIQLIGNESESNNSWLWGWENVYNLPDKILTYANRAKALGEEWGLAPLMTPQFELNNTYNGFNMSVVTCALQEENCCFYRADYEDGVTYVAISDLPDELFQPINTIEIMHTALSCTKQYNISQLIFMEHFLKQNNTPFDWIKDCIIVHTPQQDMEIKFEEKHGTWQMVSYRAL
jgi:hypothetical protein